MDDIPPALRDRISKIAAASKAIYKATRDTRAELLRLGYRFPAAVDMALSHLDLTSDQLFLLLSSENPARRIDSQDQGSGDQDPPKN